MWMWSEVLNGKPHLDLFLSTKEQRQLFIPSENCSNKAEHAARRTQDRPSVCINDWRRPYSWHEKASVFHGPNQSEPLSGFHSQSGNNGAKFQLSVSQLFLSSIFFGSTVSHLQPLLCVWRFRALILHTQTHRLLGAWPQRTMNHPITCRSIASENNTHEKNLNCSHIRIKQFGSNDSREWLFLAIYPFPSQEVTVAEKYVSGAAHD